MTDSRAEIFNRLQQALPNCDSNKDARAAAIKEHLSSCKRGVVPAYTDNFLDRFISKNENVAATVNCIKNISELSAAVYEYLTDNQIEPNLVAAPTDLLKQVDWQKEIKIEHRPAQGSDITTLTQAYAGVAETGSLVLCSDKDSPTTLNFLPDNNICIIHQSNIYPCMEDIWALLRKQNKEMPRAINFITGPSRTADVEQTIQLGAHGPRRLHIIILENH